MSASTWVKKSRVSVMTSTQANPLPYHSSEMSDLPSSNPPLGSLLGGLAPVPVLNVTTRRDRGGGGAGSYRRDRFQHPPGT